jgi:hypothetical protein
MFHLLLYAAFGCGVINLQTNPPLTADQIMHRVAANQDRSEELRSHYLYKQVIHVASRKTNGKLMQDEVADYLVVPNSDASAKKLTALKGKYWQKDRYVEYSGHETSDRDRLDGDLVSDLRDDLANEKQTKDGIAANLFPLTSKEQEHYGFKLLGEEVVNGRKAYRIAFRPKDKADREWKGEAIIDTEEFEPVTIFTKLARRVPFWVRTGLGTDVPDVGFSVSYKRQPDGVWFPISFGTEFRVRAVFFINREITVSLQNSDFEKTHVDAVVHYETSSLH